LQVLASFLLDRLPGKNDNKRKGEYNMLAIAGGVILGIIGLFILAVIIARAGVIPYSWFND
jgi:hypothetical protein